MSGEKKVEFRKVCFKHKITHAIVYSTSPQKKIVAITEVDGVDAASPEEIWKRYNRIGGVEKEFFLSYFKYHNKAFAIKLGQVYRLLKPQNIEFLDRSLKPPQSFCYVDNRKAIKLISNKQLILS